MGTYSLLAYTGVALIVIVFLVAIIIVSIEKVNNINKKIIYTKIEFGRASEEKKKYWKKKLNRLYVCRVFPFLYPAITKSRHKKKKINK